MPGECTDQSLTTSQDGVAMTNDPSSAQRGFSEISVSRDPSDEISHAAMLGTEASEKTTNESLLGARPAASRKGYWDIMSIFRSGNAKSSAQSESNPRSQPDHI